MSNEASDIVDIVLATVVPGSTDWGDRVYSRSTEAAGLVDAKLAALTSEIARLKAERDEYGDALEEIADTPHQHGHTGLAMLCTHEMRLEEVKRIAQKALSGRKGE